MNAGNIVKNSEMLASLSSEVRSLREMFREVETQFRWGTDVQNVRAREFDRLLAVMWKKCFNEDLPAASLPNAGPNHSNGNGK